MEGLDYPKLLWTALKLLNFTDYDKILTVDLFSSPDFNHTIGVNLQNTAWNFCAQNRVK